MIPVPLWAIAAAAAVWVASLGAAGYVGVGIGQDSEVARTAREAELVAKVTEAAALGAAAEISKIDIQRQTIIQPVERTIREKPVYRDCVHAPDVLRGINEALTGRSSGQLPAAGRADRP